MTFFRKLFIAALRRKQPCIPLLALVALLALSLGGQTSEAADRKTAFLPFKINATTDADKLLTLTDTALQEILTTSNLAMIPRPEAESLTNYQGSWPPPINDLQKIAATKGADNVAAGSLTVLGNQISIDIKVFDLLAPANPSYYSRTVNSPDALKTELNSLLGDVLAYTDREFRIASIAPEGNKLIDSGAILRKISSKVDAPYNPAQLREDLKAIFAMGYFNDVQILTTDSSQGKAVVFKVIEKPVISSLTFTGMDELKEEDVRGAANVREHFVLNPSQVNEGTEKIKELYKSKGYYNTEVTADITFPTSEGAVVQYTIKEGEKIYIKDISFEGNTTFEDDELADEIETGEKGWFSWLTASGLLEMDKIKQDADKIVSFYHNHGFLEARVGEPVIRQEENWLHLTFSVEEGPRFKVGSIDVSGDLIFPKEQLLDLLTIRKEEYISSKIVRENIMAINDLYAEQGYAFADVRPNLDKSASGKRVDVNFKIGKGDLVYINRIIIRGNTKTRDNVIRRELRVAEGGVFNSKALRDSNNALQRIQIFEEVNITPEPAIDPGRMNIIIEVKEKSTTQLAGGVGYSTVDDLILTGSVSENNFLGRGDELQLSANIGGSSSRYNLSYTNPSVNDSPLFWSANLFSSDREYDDYTKDSKGGGLRLGYPIFEKWRIYGNYSYTDTDLTDVADDASYYIRNSVDLPVTSSVKTSLVRDTRNKLLFGATAGSRHQVSVEYAGGPFGGDGQFTKVEGSTSWFFPLVLGTTFHFEGSAGQVYENETDKLPVYERFYLGGMNSIRGFDSLKISPIDPVTGDRIGGDKMWYSNWEFIFPLLASQGIQGMVFYDIGQVLNDDEDWNLDSYAHAAGVGVTWLSPLGPLSVVWGYNLDPKPDEDQTVWDFSVGGTF